MPFPNKEIAQGYKNSKPFPQSSFAQEEGFHCAYENYLEQYALILKRKEEELEKQLRELLGFLMEMNEYEKEHSFTEGWKMAKRQGN